MAISIALLGFNDLGHSVTPTFLFRNRFYYNYLLLSKNEKKNQCGKVQKNHYFCPRDIKSSHHAAARRVKLWSLNANLFVKEPRQLNKFAYSVHLNHIGQRTFLFKALIAMFWDLQPLWPFSPTKPDLLRFTCYSRHILSKTKSVTPYFFFFFFFLHFWHH